MTKKEIKAINKFVLKMTKLGAFVMNTQLPKRMWASQPKYGYTAVLTRSEFLKAWGQLRKQLEA